MNEVDFSDDFYKGRAVNVNVNGKRFGIIKFIPDKLLLVFTGKDGERKLNYFNLAVDSYG